jgi:hypothetical protein
VDPDPDPLLLRKIWQRRDIYIYKCIYFNVLSAEFVVQVIFFLIRIVGGGVHIGSPRGTAAMYWPIVPVPGDCEDGEVGGMKCGWQGKPKYSRTV